MYDYKEILRKKADSLNELFDKYKEKLDSNKQANIKNLIQRVYQLTNGSLDAMDYDERDKTIMELHSELDNQTSFLKNTFEKENQNQNTK